MVKFMLLALLASTTAGCAFRQQTTGLALEHNEFVTQATNRQTVTNILRARDREPMHFTSFGTVRGRVELTGSGELTTTLNGNSEEISTTTSNSPSSVVKTIDGATNFAPKVSVSVQTGTTFDINVNANDEFYKGIMGPIADKTIVYLLRQQWPSELISYLVIERMDFTAMLMRDGKLVERIPLFDVNNDPKATSESDSPKFTFADAIRCRRLDVTYSPAKKNDLPVATIADLEGTSAEVLAKIRRTPAGEGVPLPAKTVMFLPNNQDATFGIALSKPWDITSCNVIRANLPSIFVAKIDNFNEENIDKRARALDDARIQGRSEAQIAELLSKYPDVSAIRFAENNLSDVKVRAGKSALMGKALTSDSDSRITQGLSGMGGSAFVSENYFNDYLSLETRKNLYTVDLTIEITFRSVESILYYLGEYSRSKPTTKNSLFHGKNIISDGKTTCKKIQELEMPIPDSCFDIPVIAIFSGRPSANEPVFAEVEFKNKRYWMPSSGEPINATAGRSSQVVSLVQQLLNLHRSAKDLPTTPLVAVR